jgi:hypothetical protein
MIENHISELLSTSAAVKALVGGEEDSSKSRVYYMQAVQNGDMPCIVINKISGVRSHVLTGPDGLANPRFQIDSIAKTYTEAKRLADAVRQTLDGYRGTLKETAVHGCSLDNERDIFENAIQPPLYRIVMDFMVWHSES